MSFNQLFEKLFLQYKKELLYYATQKAEHVADDLVQESFLQLWVHPDPDTIINHRAYLYKITDNLLIAHYRKQSILARYHESCDDLDSLSAQLPDLEMSLHYERLLMRCLEALKALPVQQRTVFFLHRMDGMTYLQIARMLGISRATVERYFQAAMEACILASLQTEQLLNCERDTPL